MYLAPYVTRYMLLLLPLPFAFAFTLQLAPYPLLAPYPYKMLSVFFPSIRLNGHVNSNLPRPTSHHAELDEWMRLGVVRSLVRLVPSVHSP